MFKKTRNIELMLLQPGEKGEVLPLVVDST
jgi:hypothetical protein